MRLSDLLTVRDKGQLASRGGQDSITLHVNPREADVVVPMLKGMGGSGRFNPMTGGFNFDDGGFGSDESSGTGTESGGDAFSDGSVDSGLSSNTGTDSGWSASPGWGGYDWSYSYGLSAEDQAAQDAFNSAVSAGYQGSIGDFVSGLFSDPNLAGLDGRNQFNEEDASQGGQGAARGGQFTADQNARAVSEANQLGWQGDWNGVFGNTDLQGGTFTNWGGLANNVVNSPVTQIAAGLLGGLPAALAVGAARAAHQGNYGNVLGNLASFINPAAGAAINTASSLYNQGPAGLLASLANYGINTQGLNLGQGLNDLLGNDRGSFSSALTGSLGNMAQGAGIGAAAGALGLGGWGDYLSGSGYGEAGSDSGNASTDGGQSNTVASSLPSTSSGSSGSSGALSAILSGSSGYSPFKAYTAGLQTAATTTPTEYNAALPQTLDLTKLLGQQPAKSFYGQNRPRLASILNQGDYYAD